MITGSLRKLLIDVRRYLKEEHPSGALIEADPKSASGFLALQKERDKKPFQEESKPSPLPPKLKTSPIEKPLLKESIVPQSEDDSAIKSTFQRLFPHIPLKDPTKRQKLPKVQVLLFTDFNPERHAAFLKNLALAIDARLCPCRTLSLATLTDERLEKLIETRNCKLFILSSYTLYKQQKLSRAYEEGAPAKIGNTPVIILKDIGRILDNPSFKPKLWQAIKDLL